MADDPLSKLMRSPFEEDPPRRKKDKDRSGGVASWWPLPVAVAVGGLVALAGLMLTGDEAAVVATTSPPTTAAVVALTETGPFPAGYHQLNELVAARPERLLSRDGTLFVSFTTAVRFGLDPEGTSSFGGGKWQLVLEDGRRIDSLGEFLDPFAPGAFSLAFPIEDFSVDDVVEVRLVGEVLRAGTSHTTVLQFEDGLPWTGRPGDNRIPLEGTLDFVVDEIQLIADGGTIAWHLEGNEEPGATVTAELVLFAQGSNFPAGQFEAHANTDFFSFFGAAIPPPSVERSGTTVLEGSLGRAGEIVRAQLTWTIDWVSYLPTDASIPLDDVRLVTVAS